MRHPLTKIRPKMTVAERSALFRECRDYDIALAESTGQPAKLNCPLSEITPEIWAVVSSDFMIMLAASEETLDRLVTDATEAVLSP